MNTARASENFVKNAPSLPTYKSDMNTFRKIPHSY